MNLKKFLSISLLAALIVGAAVFAFPAGTVAAQSPTPQPQDPQTRINLVNIRLQMMLRLEKATLNRMTRRFDRLDQLITRVETLVDRAKENGKDVAALEAALTEFKAKESEARGVLDSVSSLLEVHPGFDDNGKVTDRETARTTLEDGHAQFQEIRSIMGDSLKNLQEAVKAWREANPPEATPSS